MRSESAMSYRIIQWGTGNVGKHALRTIVERPDFELVGLRVYNLEKVGADAGDLLGRDATGVIATDDVDAIVALDADCVCYTALGSTLDDRGGPLDDICRLLASGKNVVSSAVEYFAYFPPGLSLKGAGNAQERLGQACAKGRSSFFHVGINPGFAMDMWPLNMTRLCARIDHLHATEVVDMTRYPSFHMVREVMGFGIPPGAPNMVDGYMGDVLESPFYLSMRMIADGLRIELDDINYQREVAVADKPIDIASGTIEAGTVAATRFHYQGILYGRPAITLEWIWRTTDDVAPEWPTGDSRWILRVDGNPTIATEIDITTTEDACRGTSIAVATLLLNAVPTVCAAPPGILDNLTLPSHSGGYFLA
jgi:2,4-diaminopentanoate dehydrogenase